MLSGVRRLRPGSAISQVWSKQVISLPALSVTQGGWHDELSRLQALTQQNQQDTALLRQGTEQKDPKRITDPS